MSTKLSVWLSIPAPGSQAIVSSSPPPSPQPLEDTFYAVSKSAARLRRRVEMYQWIEDTEERSGVKHCDVMYCSNKQFDYDLFDTTIMTTRSAG